MLGVDTVIIGAVSTAVVVIIAAIAKAAVEIIKALHEARDERAIAATRAKTASEEAAKVATKAVDAAVEAKETAKTGTEDIRNDLSVVVTGLARLDGRFTSLERKVTGLGKDQNALLGMVVTLDEKVDKHVEDTLKGKTNG